MKCSILWAQFPLRDSADLVNMARRHSVRVAAGSIRTCDKTPIPFVRIDVDRPQASSTMLRRTAQGMSTASARRRTSSTLTPRTRAAAAQSSSSGLAPS